MISLLRTDIKLPWFCFRRGDWTEIADQVNEFYCGEMNLKFAKSKRLKFGVSIPLPIAQTNTVEGRLD